MARLSNGLLELAQAERDRMGIKTTPLRVDEVIFSARNDSLKPCPTRGIEVEFADIPENEDFLTVMGHEGMLRTVFLNLIDNACKFSQDQKAAVFISFDEKQVNISITDKGIGIQEEDYERIFLPFYRSDNVRQIKGHGLGLSICRKIIQLHNGEISVSSTPGKGSTFTVSLLHL